MTASDMPSLRPLYRAGRPSETPTMHDTSQGLRTICTVWSLLVGMLEPESLPGRPNLTA